MSDSVAHNQEIVNDFLEKFKSASQESLAPFKFEFFKVGSAYENLAVDYNSDFDIALALQGDYVSDNFNIKRHEDSDYFYLESKKSMAYSNNDGIVDAVALRHDIFRSLMRHIDEKLSPDSPDTKFFYTMGQSALSVRLIKYCDEDANLVRNVGIDLVPTIAIKKWSDCPDLLPIEEMPQSLRDSIKKSEREGYPCAFLSLGIPLSPNNINENDCRFSVISFSLLEKDFILSDPSIRDIVMMTKQIAKENNWKGKYSFKYFLAKRLAMKYCDELKEMDVAEGCHLLLKRLKREVRTNHSIDQYFINNQHLVGLPSWTPEEEKKFCSEISAVKKSVYSRMSSSPLRYLINRLDRNSGRCFP